MKTILLIIGIITVGLIIYLKNWLKDFPKLGKVLMLCALSVTMYGQYSQRPFTIEIPGRSTNEQSNGKKLGKATEIYKDKEAEIFLQEPMTLELPYSTIDTFKKEPEQTDTFLLGEQEIWYGEKAINNDIGKSGQIRISNGKQAMWSDIDNFVKRNDVEFRDMMYSAQDKIESDYLSGLYNKLQEFEGRIKQLESQKAISPVITPSPTPITSASQTFEFLEVKGRTAHPQLLISDPFGKSWIMSNEVGDATIKLYADPTRGITSTFRLKDNANQDIFTFKQDGSMRFNKQKIGSWQDINSSKDYSVLVVDEVGDQLQIKIRGSYLRMLLNN